MISHMCFDFDHYQCTDSVQLIRVNPNFWIVCTVHSTVNQQSKSKSLDYLRNDYTRYNDSMTVTDDYESLTALHKTLSHIDNDQSHVL